MILFYQPKNYIIPKKSSVDVPTQKRGVQGVQVCATKISKSLDQLRTEDLAD